MKNIKITGILATCAFLLLIAGPALLLAQSAGQPQAQGQQQAQDQQITQETAQNQGAELRISPAALRLIQQRLNEGGFSAGSVDGLWGSKTQQAIGTFQQTQGLEPTGNINLETLQAIGVTQVLGGSEYQQQAEQSQDQRISQERAAQGGARLYISPASLRQIEQNLNQQGYDSGEVDGVWDSQTQQGIRNFQQANNLEPTGNLNAQLFSALGLDQLIAGLTGQGQSQMAGAGQTDAQQRGYFGGKQGQSTSGDQAMRWSQETATSGGAPLFVSPATVRQIQQSLNDQGYQTGNVDGSWNRDTQQAVMSFQQAKGMEPTGNLNLATIQSLIGGLGEGAQGGRQTQSSDQQGQKTQDQLQQQTPPSQTLPTQQDQQLQQNQQDQQNLEGQQTQPGTNQ